MNQEQNHFCALKKTVAGLSLIGSTIEFVARMHCSVLRKKGYGFFAWIKWHVDHLLWQKHDIQKFSHKETCRVQHNRSFSQLQVSLPTKWFAS